MILLALKSIRIHQWMKNVLIFIPLVMAHEFNNPVLLVRAFYAFLAFGFCASAAYLVNDLKDLKQDQKHPKKKYRPLASGNLSKKTALIIIPMMLALSFLLSLLLPQLFLAVLGGYFLITLAYSFYLRSLLLVDVLCLAALYTIRIFAGALAVQVPVSSWLLAFAVFFFLSLALVKRCAELRMMQRLNIESGDGRAYLLEDTDQLARLGTASGYIAVLVMALYITRDEVTELYSHPDRLWFICPVILFWISRIWIVANRGRMRDDPILFAIKDKASYFAGFLTLLLILLAI